MVISLVMGLDLKVLTLVAAYNATTTRDYAKTIQNKIIKKLYSM